MARRKEAGTLTAAILGATLVTGFALPAQAGDNKLEFSANTALTTDYVFRGISQTENGPAIQGGIDATYGLFYIGFWGSNVDFGAGDPSDIEIDYYGGITPSWQGIDFDLGVIFYTYPDSGPGVDIVEGKLGVSKTFMDALTVGFTGYFSDRSYQAYEFGAEYGFTNKWWMFAPSVSALVGFVETDGSYVGSDYTYWNAGLTLGFWDQPNLAIDIRYWDTDNGNACNQFCDSRAVATLSAAF
jgi:uncharacterized protein (TIGR02001 family)